MKRVIIILSIIFSIFLININVKAKTLGDLKKELAALEAKQKANNEKKKLTQNEINNANNRISTINGLITKSQNRITELTGEIATLEKNASDKETEIKDIILFLQITNSENAYMEYIFGAQTIEDLILRSAVSEQMVEYNNQLIDSYNKTVIEYRAKQEEQKLEITKLNTEQDNLETELVSLGDQLEEVMDVGVDIAEEIAAQKKVVSYYQDTLKCKDNQDITTCGQVVYSGKFIRPTTAGYITSGFGYRVNPLNGKKQSFHSGTDMVTSKGEVYPVAPGTVAGMYKRTSCGGNMLFINHNVGGVHYTSAYFHLYQFKVKVGDSVDVNTVIGITGGNIRYPNSGGYTPWDRCTTGRHLHLSIAKGWFFKEYSSYSKFTANLINPVSVVNFPSNGKTGKWFRDRTTIYK